LSLLCPNKPSLNRIDTNSPIGKHDGCKDCPAAAWQSGHRVLLRKDRSRVRILPQVYKISTNVVTLLSVFPMKLLHFLSPSWQLNASTGRNYVLPWHLGEIWSLDPIAPISAHGYDTTWPRCQSSSFSPLSGNQGCLLYVEWPRWWHLGRAFSPNLDIVCRQAAMADNYLTNRR
jgi:hypothetical protein